MGGLLQKLISNPTLWTIFQRLCNKKEFRLLTHYQHIFNSTYSYLKQTGAKMIPVMYNYAERQNDDEPQRTIFDTYPRADPYSKADSRRPVVYRKNTSRTKCDH